MHRSVSSAETIAATQSRHFSRLRAYSISGRSAPELMATGQRAEIARIVSAEDTDRCKPDPEGYRLAFEALRTHGNARPAGLGHDATGPLAPSACLVIEDTLAGVMSARGAGMKVVGVSTTYDADSLRKAGADDVVKALADFTPEWIERRFC